MNTRHTQTKPGYASIACRLLGTALLLLTAFTATGATPIVESVFKWKPRLAAYNPGRGNDFVKHPTDGYLYGAVVYGGTHGYGAVFRMDAAGETEPLVSFNGSNGYFPRGLVLGPDGKFYGTTEQGGSYGYGTVFSMTTAGELTTLVSFNYSGATNKGAYPQGSLTFGADGKLYGLTRQGGNYGHGTAFSMTTSGELTTLAHFNSSYDQEYIYDYDYYYGWYSYSNSSYRQGARGASPFGSLTLGADGKLYGMTEQGGSYGYGTAFLLTSAGELTTLVNFDYSTNGGYPQGSLTLGADGKFYGMTHSGGSNGYGTAFSMTSTGELTTLVNFDYSTNGGYPYGNLTLGADGKFFGMTSSGGSNGYGTAFSMTLAGEHISLLHFTYSGEVKGAHPAGSLTLGADGKLYGMTSSGGSYGYGTFFSMSTAGQHSVLVHLNSYTDGNYRGAQPYGALTLGTDGKFYGMTAEGGNFNNGTVFSLTPDGIHTVLVHFNGNYDYENVNYYHLGARGGYPYGNLTLGADGKFYGMTNSGGSNGSGTVFSMTTTGELTTLVLFNYSSSGAYPLGGLTLGPDGKFYGMAQAGGSNAYGTVFSMTSAGELTTLINFDYYTNGGNPTGSLSLGADGKFYGVTQSGGSNGYGTAFAMTAAGELTTLINFDYYPHGGNPVGSLTLGADGKFYGITQAGGSNGYGTVFSMTSTGALTTLANFNYTNGANPYSTLTFGANGNLYGTTNSGGAYGQGTVFSMTPAGEITTLLDFRGSGTGPEAGQYPIFGQLTAGPDGHLYGTVPGYSYYGAPYLGIVYRIRDAAASPSPGTVAFSAASYSVNQGATSAALTLTRSGGSAAFDVTLNTDNGTASKVPPFAAALAVTDYVDLSGAATTVSFGAGEMTKTVTMTLIPKTATNTPNKRFTAKLTNPSAGGALGDIPTTTVEILAIDTTPPALLVYGPTAAATLSAAHPYRTYGTVGDLKGVAKVELVLNGGAPADAVIDMAASSAAQPWSLGISPVNGANTLTITAFDLAGNSTTVTRTFAFTTRYRLSLARTAPSGIALDTAGTLAITAAPSTSASALTPVTAHANPKTSDIVAGATVKVTATAKKDYNFSHWTGVPAGAVEKGNVISFTMPAADVSGLTAHFVANPFLAAPGSSNVFYGLVNASGGATASNATEGFLTGTLVPSSGAFTGKIVINGLTQSFTSNFYGNGSSMFTVGAAKQPTLTVGTATLSLGLSGGAIQATVTNGGVTSTGTATRARYTATAKVPAALRNAGATTGTFTVSFPAKAQSPAVDTATYPQGDGFATVTLKEDGTLTLVGTLADGTAITGGSALVAGNACPILVQLITPGAAATAKGGSLSGVLTFDATLADSDVSGSDLLWFRPAVTQQTGTTVAALATQLYTAGWPEGIRVDALGALYDKSQSVQSTLGLEAANATDGNAQLHFSDGQLTKDIVKTNFNITGSTVATLKDSSYTLAPVAASGTFSGTFTPNWTNPDKVKPAFKGILIQKGASKGGYGFFISNAKSDLDPQSGGVTLGGPKTEFTEVAVEGMPRKSWTAVATSTDGSKIVVVGQFCMVTSTDSGATWQTRDDSRLWASVASSADGTRLIAGTYAGEVWISINSGATWTQSLSGLVHSMSVASSANGVKLAAAARDGAIWISHDSGATWAAKSNSQRWTSIGSSADGTVLVAGDQDTGAWTSLDSGATWTQRTPTDKLAGYSVAISSDGSKMSSTDGWNQVWVSNDSGMTWTQAPSEVSGYSSVVTKNGSKIVALAYGTMSTSTDSGLTWTTQSYSSNYRSIAFAANGKPVLTAEFDGLLYRWE